MGTRKWSSRLSVRVFALCSTLTLFAQITRALDAKVAEAMFPLVDGNRQAVIVGNDTINSCKENSYKMVKNFLQSYIQKSTGVKLKHVAEKDYDPKTMPYAIFLGNTKVARDKYGSLLKDVDRDSYIISVTPKAVYLIGARPHSTQFAMADFLYRHMGIATYIPTKWGTIVPKHKTVLVPTGFDFEAPAFNSRAFSCLRTYNDTGARLNYGSKTDIPWRLYRCDGFHHNIQNFIKVKEFGKTHPEYFPEINGKRIIISSATGPGPCIANPDVVKIFIKKVREYFDSPKNKDKNTISLGMTDGGWCECEKCQAMDGKDIRGVENKSTRYYTFLNQIGKALKETHPDKFIGVLAYAGADYPPADMRVEPNILPYICQTRANWGDENVRQEHMKQTFAWTKRVDKIGIYEYLYGSGFMVPRIYNKQLAEYLRMVISQGKAGFYAEIYSNHGLDGPKAWIVEKLLWNPYQDTDKLLKIWCRTVFGAKIAPLMESYFKYLEECNTRNVKRCPEIGTTGKARDSKFYLLQDEKQFELFTPSEIKHADSILAKALVAAKSAEIKKRIKYFKECLEVTDLSVRAYHAFNKAQELAKNNASDKKILAALIEGEEIAPEKDSIILMTELVEKDPSTFTPSMPVAVSTSTELSMRLINKAPWNAVHKAIGEGVTDRGALVAAAGKELLAIAPKNWKSSKNAKKRIGTLLAMTERIVVANKIKKAPVIDGKLDEKCWKWQVNKPWWSWKGGIPYQNETKTAYCHDGKNLYVAFRCFQNNLNSQPKCSGYGASAWKFISMEIFLNPDKRDAPGFAIPGQKGKPKNYFQAIPAIGGGIYCSIHDVVKKWEVTNTDTYWQAELVIDLDKLGMSPDKFKALRLNMIRNVKGHGHYGKGWFPSFAAHNHENARGWLVFGK